MVPRSPSTHVSNHIRVLEALDLKVNRLIRLSFGPFQLGQLEAGKVEEVPRRVLRQQLGKNWQAIVDGTIRGGRETMEETDTVEAAFKPKPKKRFDDKPKGGFKPKARGKSRGYAKPDGKASNGKTSDGKALKARPKNQGKPNARGRR